ncbi:hypothetical protein GH714_032454 [Hevea brasiliensis]|uniref:Sialyltransferase-like protein n=1 Tax=Hevea brasiliensis TaxID=3981 RepID=A0A6A6NBF5_HEVBR|nr:hypothetical protein GH714_032454 [Hevea brasiliensis]
MLLTRQKDSSTPSQKNKLEIDTMLSCNDGVSDPFSKFTFTSDVELSVRQAISDLDGWLARADSGLVDDLEKLPYVCAAMEQLKQRKKYWNEQQVCDNSGNDKCSNSRKQSQEFLLTTNANCAYHEDATSRYSTQSVDINDENKQYDNVKLDLVASPEGEMQFYHPRTMEARICRKEMLRTMPHTISTSYQDRNMAYLDSAIGIIVDHFIVVKEAPLRRWRLSLNQPRNPPVTSFYANAVAVDGQHLILHPLNMKCLLHHYGSYDMLPHRVRGTILQLETLTQSEAMRRRYRYLSHFSLTTTFQLCEINLSEMLPPDALFPFLDEIKKREKQRKQLAKKERKEQVKAEVAAAAHSVPILSNFEHSFHDDSPKFSIDDFEGTKNSGTPTFANVISREKTGESLDAPRMRGADKCYDRSLCEEHLNLILPAKSPFHPRQFGTCAVVGNSGDLLKTEFGKEIDSHDAVIRDNEAPVNEKYARHVGLKRDFRLVVRGAARNMVKILNGSTDEVLIIKSVTHRDFNEMIKSIPNPVYLFQGIVLRRGAKGTGMKSIELALSMCDTVDIYGFTVDPGYTEWTRYFSTPRKGHNPLQGRAYYQLLECLVIRIHSPTRAQRKQDWSDVPSREMISRAHAAALHLKRGRGPGQFGSCKVWGNVDPEAWAHLRIFRHE